jgi:protein-S-isoprenylcysteine O-methyltransferase Ste14
MAVAALVLSIAWLVLVLGVRMLVQTRRTGDSGLRHQRHSRLELVAHLLMAAAVLTGGLIGPIAGILGLAPLGPLASTGVQTVGLVLAIVGIGLTLTAQLGMGDSWRIGVDPDERTTLVTGGLFSLTRNPIFSAAILTAVGIAVMAGNIITLLGAAALVIAFELQVRHVEEPYLRSTHGDEYTAYATRVGRFAPGIGRLS